MNTKLLTTAGCLLLLAATISPTVLGHDERGSFGTATGVSGHYFSPAGVSTTDSALNNAGVQEGQDTTSAAGNMLCDLEVAGPGDAAYPVDESSVDGAAGGLLGNTIDDGGQGGACHTRTYAHGAYNTPGCPAATAKANDVNFGGNVWIGASCDWEAQGSDGGVLVCITNGVIHASVPEIADCVLQLVACLSFPADCAGGANDVCGSDGTSDGTNFGFGGNGVAYPTGPTPGAHFGEWYSASGDSDDDSGAGDKCPASDATAATFVFSNVDTVNGAQPATEGDIWQT